MGVPPVPARGRLFYGMRRLRKGIAPWPLLILSGAVGLAGLPPESPAVSRHGLACPGSSPSRRRISAWQPKRIADGGLRMARIASGQVVAHAQGIWPGMPEFSIQHTVGEPEGSAGAKGRTKPPKATAKPRSGKSRKQNVESRNRAAQSHPKPPQGHIVGIY